MCKNWAADNEIVVCAADVESDILSLNHPTSRIDIVNYRSSAMASKASQELDELMGSLSNMSLKVSLSASSSFSYFR